MDLNLRTKIGSIYDSGEVISKIFGGGETPKIFEKQHLQASQKVIERVSLASLEKSYSTMFSLETKSKIDLVNQSTDILYQWMGERPAVGELIYRGSRDGFSVKDFHSKTHGAPSPTLIFI
jgi:hypothetical protein